MATASARRQREETALRQVACPHCGVSKGRWCRTRRGHSADHLHDARLRALAARTAGYPHLDLAARRLRRIKVRDLYREGRGTDDFETAMLDLADVLDRDGIGVPAGELRALVRAANSVEGETHG